MAWRSDSLSPPTTVFSFRMSMISTAGIGRPPTRLGIASRVYRPRSALRQLSSDGVAEPRITGMPSICARLTATSRTWYRGVVSCLKLLSCSSSMTRSPSRRAGAKTADRAPTTTWTSPEAMLCQWRCRSASLMWLCKYGDPGKPPAEPADRLRRQADLGYQHDRLPAPRHDFLDRRQVHLGLAAAGDAVDQERGEAARLDRRYEPLEGRGLLGGQDRAAPAPWLVRLAAPAMPAASGAGGSADVGR